MKNLIYLSLLCLVFFSSNLQGAERITFTKGLFTENLAIEDLRRFYETGDTDGLGLLLSGDVTTPEQLKKLLGTTANNLRVADGSRVFRSKAGFQILLNLGQRIKPFRNATDDIAAKSLRAAVIKSLSDDNSFTVLEIFENYSADTIFVTI